MTADELADILRAILDERKELLGYLKEQLVEEFRKRIEQYDRNKRSIY